MASSSRKRSPIWSFFSVAEDTKYAICNSCKQKVSRGGSTTKTFNTSNLLCHLKTKHGALELKEFEKLKETDSQNIERTISTAEPKQLTIQQAQNRSRAWDVNDAQAQTIHRRIAEMIALDCQPFSIVQDHGFAQLLKALEPRYSLPSRQYITETIIPQVKNDISVKLRAELDGVQFFSFTTDIWSTDISHDSLLSLTAHWITNSFLMKSAVLQARSFPGSHTGENIAAMYTVMFDEWSIRKEQVHLIVRDNAANMIKAMKDAGYTDLGCFAHTLQLVVHDGVFSQRLVKDTIAICWKNVGHFKHSPLACTKLKEIQESLGLPIHRLKQDEPTRWNSTLYMLRSILEQKMALGAYSTGHSITQLTSNQLDIISKVVAILSPIEEITNSISTAEASVSLIIPFIRALHRTLEYHTNDSGVKTMKAEMLASLKRRYADVEIDEPLVLATMLDPRFKDKFFSGVGKRIRAKVLLEEKVAEINDKPEEIREPTPKRPKTAVLKVFSEILEEAGESFDSCHDPSVDKYLSEPLLAFHRGNSFTWWEDNKARYPSLAKLAQRYLSAPPTSVPSERLFSCARDVYDEKRNRIAPERAETLLFIKNNFRVLST